jgi:hypothetical protein
VPKTSTSIVLLTVLLAGIVTPTIACAFRCDRNSRVQIQRHCDHPSDGMPGMVHRHSAIMRPDVGATSLISVSQSCRSNCVTTQPLYVSRKIVPNVRVVQTGAVVLDITAEFLPPAPAAAWSSDGGPPAPLTASSASFSILRI